MNYQNKYPIIILISGKARSGKSTVAKYLKENLEQNNKKVIISPYTKYLKQYIKDITQKRVTEKNKPRDLLQKLSSELIKDKLGYKDFFIRRQIEDINFYSYFTDYIIIPDVRFKEEIEKIKNKFKNVISIRVKRDNYISNLTIEQQQDITEIALDNYNKYDYIINNTKTITLKEETIKIINEIKERRQEYE